MLPEADPEILRREVDWGRAIRRNIYGQDGALGQEKRPAGCGFRGAQLWPPGEGVPSRVDGTPGGSSLGARAGLLQAHRSLAPTPPYLEGRRA